MHDVALNLLLPYLQEPVVPTLWFADENVTPLLQQIASGSNNLYIVCNRYDIYQLALKRGFTIEYTDFNPVAYRQTPARILYRISKEKHLVHHLLSLSAQYLSHGGELLLAGQKQDGVKGYHDRLLKHFACEGQLKKKGKAYLGHYSHFLPPDFPSSANEAAATDNYQQLQKIPTHCDDIPFFYSKPGVFGWQKIDRGSELLLSCLPRFLDKQATRSQSLLDLGCGYGWLFMKLGHYQFNRVVATDNNPAALLCAQKNSDAYALNVDICASDAGDNLTERFDVIVCNPPFHQGFTHSQSLTRKFVDATAKRLADTGSAFLVVNEFVPVEKIAQGYSLQVIRLCQQSGFKVLKLAK